MALIWAPSPTILHWFHCNSIRLQICPINPKIHPHQSMYCAKIHLCYNNCANLHNYSSEGVKLRVPWVGNKWKDWEGMPRKNVTSDEHGINQKYIIPLKVTFQEAPLIRTCIVNIQGGWEYIYKKSCYRRIECSVANSLTALIEKWSLNSILQPYSYPKDFKKVLMGQGST